jgi:formate/nitrite transporter FocA (FNT family)
MSDRSRREAGGPPRTPLVKRTRTVCVLAVAFLLARIVGHPLWVELLVFVAANIVGILILHVVFHQSLARLLAYQEWPDE